MANLIKDKLDLGYRLMVFTGDSTTFPTEGYDNINIVYYGKADHVSKTWDTTNSQYVALDTLEDVLFYDTYSLFPATGSSDSLYTDNSTLYVYSWNGTAYEFESSLITKGMVLSNGLKIHYSHPAIPEQNVSLNTSYTFGYDGAGCYITSDGTTKIRLSEAEIIQRFSLYGTTWTILLGADYVPSTIVPISIDNETLRNLLDSDGDNKIDYSELSDNSNNAYKLGGQLPSFYTNYSNLTGKPIINYKWKESHVLTATSTTITLTNTYLDSANLLVVNATSGLIYEKDVHFSIAGQVITVVALSEDATFVVYNLEV